MMLLIWLRLLELALLTSVKFSVSHSRISFPVAAVLIAVAVCLGFVIIANTLHAVGQATLVLPELSE
jgi:hypothetical protein